MGQPFLESDDLGVPYFAVSPAKLVTMSLATGGLYDLYLFYASWRQIERRTGHPKQPFAQMLVLPISFFRLGARVNRSLGNREPRWSLVNVGLPSAYVILRLFGNASGAIGLISL